ncbi:MAG: DUF3387 domain-containing protein [Bacteroidaceae bacterium]|nr:DUF3387 domain-containing protein [Bacteroidaceae bacterium]
MRVMVKRLLKKYHYPPEGQEQALQTVMAQCNRWADDEGNFQPVGDVTTSKVVPLHPVDYLNETSEEEEMSKAAETENS